MSSGNLDLPRDLSSEKKAERNPNWLSMKTGGQFSKFEEEVPVSNTEDYK